VRAARRGSTVNHTDCASNAAVEGSLEAATINGQALRRLGTRMAIGGADSRLDPAGRRFLLKQAGGPVLGSRAQKLVFAADSSGELSAVVGR